MPFRTHKKPAFIPSALTLKKWTDGVEEEKEKESGRGKEHAKLVEVSAEVISRGDPLYWTSVLSSKPTP